MDIHKGYFDFGYFDNDIGQILFLNGILMDIKINIGEIWRKLSVSVINHIHYITARNQLFLTPPCKEGPFIAPGGFPKKSRDACLILVISVEQLFGN